MPDWPATSWPMDLSKARILCSNDDGIHAPGFEVLERIARSLSDDVWVVAPETEQSGTGHSLTLRRPLRIRKVSEKRYSVDGTPTDCVLLAINQIMKDKRPTLVLSGVNRGVIWARTSPIPAPWLRRWSRRCSAFRRSRSARFMAATRCHGMQPSSMARTLSASCALTVGPPTH